jgi:RNA polymerase sigma-70 factor (ECF subfamily)
MGVRQEPWRVLLKNYPRFRSFVMARVANPSDAEEILQSSFARAAEKLDSVRGENVVAWLFRVLRNAVTDYYRHRDAEHRTLDRHARAHAETEAYEPAVEQVVCGCVLRAIPTLRTDFAKLLRRIDLEGASIAEVAAETGSTSNNMRVRLHRARAALRKKLMTVCGSCAENGGCLDCTCGHSTST